MDMRPRNHTWVGKFFLNDVDNKQLWSLRFLYVYKFYQYLTADIHLKFNIFIFFQVHGRNLLLIDHPVGTGFSYAENKSLFVKTDKDAG